MSIVIHGMDMPTDKPIALIINPDGQVSEVGNYEKTWEAAAVDAAEVCRCRECRHGLHSEYYGNVVCCVHHWTRGPKYYCGDGKRREDGDNGTR